MGSESSPYNDTSPEREKEPKEFLRQEIDLFPLPFIEEVDHALLIEAGDTLAYGT